MRKNSKSFIHHSMLATFLAITFLFTSCSFGGSDKDSAEEATEVTTTDDDAQKQEMREESPEIEEIDAITVVEITDDDDVITMAEQMPEYPGGEKALMKYLSENIEYPEKAREARVEGKVFVSFVVKKDGKVGDVVIVKGIGHGCDEEAFRVVNEMPDWSPGYEKGKPVRVKYTLPINFSLQ